MTPLALWNAAPPSAAEATLLSCCGSPAWARTLLSRRPYAALETLLLDAESIWFALPEPEWLTAFACHPRIGELHAALPPTPAFAEASASEQSTAQATLDPVAAALAAANRLYEQRFGFLYIVFASGRTAPELLDILHQRLGNSRSAELLEAAQQQWCITHLRLTRCLA